VTLVGCCGGIQNSHLRDLSNNLK